MTPPAGRGYLVGRVVEKTGRVDLYDAENNRTSYGTIDKDGRIDLYDLKGNRTAVKRLRPHLLARRAVALMITQSRAQTRGRGGTAPPG